ncbi:MAG: tail fiber domain-containing protein [Geobacteraceae bacterium]|nr:tail fiber domain-containing protein [Geobacteraceae bacterium]
MLLTKTRIISAILSTLALATLAFAGVPQTINYQGYITNNGTPVNNMATNVTFSLYSSNPTRNNPVWFDTHSVTPVNGIYNVQLGSQKALNAPFDVPYWLGISVAGSALPLQQLSSGPYALRAGVADSLATGATVPGVTPWVSTTSTTFQATNNNAYILNNSTPATITLPGNAAIGDIIKVNAQGAGGYTFNTVNGQSITGNGISADYSAWLPRAASKIWRSLASSADGSKFYAAAYGDYIWKSVDGGASWAISGNASVQNWQAIASSSDGTKLIAAVSGGLLYTSSDSGATWTPREIVGGEGSVSRSWQAVASTSDGTMLFAVTNGAGGQIWGSTDSGATWTNKGISSNWSSIATSADGAKVVAAATGGYVWLSGNSGSSWNSTGPQVGQTKNWGAVASSADGTKLVAADDFYIYTFDNLGNNWQQANVPAYAFMKWRSLASSADGTILAANGYVGPVGYLQASVFVSIDSGKNWSQQYLFGIDTQNSSPTSLPLAISADGGAVAVAQSNTDYIYLSGKTKFTGSQYSAAELVYAGNGQWVVNQPGAIGQGNVTTGSNALVGGTFNTVNGINSVISGGSTNVVTAPNATIAGGVLNTAGSGATVSGGSTNNASGGSSSIGGGIGNTSSGSYSTIAGGQSNIASGSYSAIGGGTLNSAGGSDSIVSGGSSNNASGLGATVFGGTNNSANGWRSTITGGLYNTASGNTSIILGGDSNTASGPYSTVVGGTTNSATDWYSLAAGCSANAAHSGAFVWSDSQCATFSSTAPNQFLVKAAGGVGINKNNPVAGALDVSGNTLVSGNLGIGTLTPNRQLHLAHSGGVEMSMLVSDGLANFRTWNIWTSGGAGVAQNLNFRLLNDLGTATTLDAFHLNSDGSAWLNGTLASGGLASTLAGGIAVNGTSTSSYGVQGTSTNSVGVVGISSNNTGIWGQANAGTAVDGMSTSGVGVLGRSTSGNGVKGTTGNAIAIYAVNNSTDAPAIEGWNQGSGYIYRGWSGASPAIKFWVDNNGNAWIGGTLTQASDIRLKTDIQPLKNTLDKVLRLRGVSYVMKADKSRTRKIGVIAQELEQEYPELVATDDKGMKSVAYANLTAVLIEAVKGLQAENDALKADNDAMKLRLERLEKAQFGQ